MDVIGTRLKNNLLHWAEKAGAQFRPIHGEYRSCCPLHHGDNKDGFAVYEKDGVQKWKCFTGACGGGDVYEFIMVWQDCEFAEAYRILGGEQTYDPLLVAKAAEEQARRAIAAMEAQMQDYQRVLEELRQTQAWLTYHRNLLENEAARKLWQARGLPADWQKFYQLGYCPEFPVSTQHGRWLTPTLTIPIWDTAWQPLNIRHRLLNPPEPNDKYRPDRAGLHSAPLLGNPNRGFDHDPILVVEGEIKAMVTYKTLYTGEDSTPQVIGIPGKTAYRDVLERLKGRDVYILFDPDAGQQAHDAALAVGGRLVTCPMKIDDAILCGALDKAGVTRLMNMGRKA